MADERTDLPDEPVPATSDPLVRIPVDGDEDGCDVDMTAEPLSDADIEDVVNGG